LELIKARGKGQELADFPLLSQVRSLRLEGVSSKDVEALTRSSQLSRLGRLTLFQPGVEDVLRVLKAGDAFQPVTALDFTRKGGLSQTDGLHLHCLASPPGGLTDRQFLARLTACPRLAQLRCLSLESRLNVAKARLLARCRHFEQLASLSLS